jgi:hypothetical protein
MATFTPAQAAQCRMYLGYPDLYRYMDPRLESILSGDQISADAMTLITGILAQLVANDALIYGTNGQPGITGEIAGLKKLEQIEFYQAQSTKDLRIIRKELATRLSNMLGVPFYGDAMGEGGYPGDTYSETGGLGNPGGGNLIPLG